MIHLPILETCPKIDKLLKMSAEEACNILSNDPDTYTEALYKFVMDSITTQIKPTTINTIEDLALLLDGNEEGYETYNGLSIDVPQFCQERKWVLCYPYSDDCIEFRGYIYDELSAWNGGHYKFYGKGEYYLLDEREEIYKKSKEPIVTSHNKNDADLIAKWDDPKSKYVWEYVVTNPNIPHAYFDLIDPDNSDDIWARACIMDFSNILTSSKNN